jgi:hypothetical protein
MPNRLIVNGSDTSRTVGANTVEPRSAKVVNVATDADLATWVGTSGIAVMNDGTSHNLRRAAALRLGHGPEGSPS